MSSALLHIDKTLQSPTAAEASHNTHTKKPCEPHKEACPWLPYLLYPVIVLDKGFFSRRENVKNVWFGLVNKSHHNFKM